MSPARVSLPLAEVPLLCNEADDEYTTGQYGLAIPLYKRALQLGKTQMSTDVRIDVFETLALCSFPSEEIQRCSKAQQISTLYFRVIHRVWKPA